MFVEYPEPKKLRFNTLEGFRFLMAGQGLSFDDPAKVLLQDFFLVVIFVYQKAVRCLDKVFVNIPKNLAPTTPFVCLSQIFFLNYAVPLL